MGEVVGTADELEHVTKAQSQLRCGGHLDVSTGHAGCGDAVSVEVEDDRFVGREEAVEVSVREAVRVFGIGRELEEVDDVDEPDLQVAEVLAEEQHRGERLLRGYVAGAGHHNVGSDALVVTRLRPDTQALGAVGHRLVHPHVLQVLLLVADDDVEVVAAPKAVVGNAQQGVHVGREIDAADLAALVAHDIEEARVLVRDLIFSGHFNPSVPEIFDPLRTTLLTGGDHYMHLADLTSYLEASGRLDELYADPYAWTRKAILNVAGSGKFSSDRTIAEYASAIWEATPCPVT